MVALIWVLCAWIVACVGAIYSFIDSDGEDLGQFVYRLMLISMLGAGLVSTLSTLNDIVPN